MEHWYDRTFGVFDNKNNLIMVVKGNLYRDCFNWERVWANNWKVLVI